MKTAIVTGASKGIGKACALQLAQDGFAVMLAYGRDKESAQDVVDQITAEGGKAASFSVSIDNEADIEELFEKTEHTLGSISLVVHAAGQITLAPLADMEVDAFVKLLSVNTTGTFLISRAAAKHVTKGGSIINLSSTVTKLSMKDYGAYTASKAAVDQITLTLAKELEGRDITVNAVAPGPTATDLFLDGKPQAVIDKLASMNPMNRLGTPEDIASVVSFLASQKGRWINGQILFANGGMA